MHAVGSYCTDMSRCTVNSILQLQTTYNHHHHQHYDQQFKRQIQVHNAIRTDSGNNHAWTEVLALYTARNLTGHITYLTKNRGIHHHMVGHPRCVFINYIWLKLIVEQISCVRRLI